MDARLEPEIGRSGAREGRESGERESPGGKEGGNAAGQGQTEHRKEKIVEEGAGDEAAGGAGCGPVDVVVLPELFAYDPYATLRASAERIHGSVSCLCEKERV